MTALAIVNSATLVLILFVLHDLRERVMRIENLHMSQPNNSKKATP
jgi:hypothetical protein